MRTLVSECPEKYRHARIEDCPDIMENAELNVQKVMMAGYCGKCLLFENTFRTPEMEEYVERLGRGKKGWVSVGGGTTDKSVSGEEVGKKEEPNDDVKQDRGVLAFGELVFSLGAD